MNEIAKNIFEIYFESNKISSSCLPGQFFNIKIDGFFLRRPISVCEIFKSENILRIVFAIKGKGTKDLSILKPGDYLDVLGPLGNGFSSYNLKNAVFIGGGIGVPPLLELSKSFKNSTSIIGFKNKSEVILEEDFKKFCNNVIVCTDDGTYGILGNVIKPLKDILNQNKTDIVFTCGPFNMMKAIFETCKEKKVKCVASFEERMACGVGACLVCALKAKKNNNIDYLHVCKDGPVFKAEEVFLD